MAGSISTFKMATKLSRIQEWPRPSGLTSFELMEGWARKLVMSLEEDAALRLEEISPAQISNYSVMLGVGAGENNNINVDSTEGIYNVFIGHNAGFTNSTGSKNIAVGYQPLYLNTTGSENVALGSEALYTNVTGANNVALGNNALYTATGSNNVAIGYLALEDKTTGDSNVAIGTSAMLNATSCASNVAIGNLAMGAGIVTGNNNVAIGVEAGEDLTDGITNVLIGSKAGTAITGGDRNVAIGYQTLQLCLTGNDNVAIGLLAAGQYTGSETVAIGRSALDSLTTGTGNVAVGYQALDSITIHANNTAVGYQALKGTTSNTDRSTAIGYQAGFSIDDGDDNTFIGYLTGYNVTDGNQNVLVGVSAGYNITTGDGNICIGYQAGAGQITTGDNKLFIDNSNTATPLIYGEFDNDFVNITKLGVNLGTTAPGARVDIQDGEIIALEIGADVGATSRTNTTRKYSRYAGYHYTNAEEPVGLIVHDSDGTDNFIHIGGGSALVNAATTIKFYTAANDTTTSGTVGVVLDSSSNLVLKKTSGKGIKVDTTTPTFGWRDLLGDQFAKNTGGTKPLLTTYNDTIDAWQFSDGDEAFLTFHIPHDYVAGTDIHLHIHWSQTYDSCTGGTIDFKYFAIYAKGHNQQDFTGTPITASFSSIDINDGGTGTNQYRHHLTEVVISAATATGALFDRDDFEPDGVIELTLEMDANSLTGVAVTDPFIHYVDLHYQSSNIGTKDKVPDFYA
ncbi:MAG: hypothetical protein V3V81_08070 [Candidatus Bathyarchaeia archaeon]